MNPIDDVVSTVVDNMRYSWKTRVIEEILEDDVRSLTEREELLRKPKDQAEYVGFYDYIKSSLLSRALNDDEQVEFLVNLPGWLGFKPRIPSDNMRGQEVVEAAVLASVSTLWIMMLPKNVVAMTAGPSELPAQPIEPFVRALLESRESRLRLQARIKHEIQLRNVDCPLFTISDALRGFDTDNEVTLGRIPHLIALLMMTATGLRVDFDRTLTMKLDDLSREVTGYILIYHVKTALKNAIGGYGARKPFAWPLIGSETACRHLATIAEIAYRLIEDLHFGRLLTEELAKLSEPPSLVNMFMYVLDEIDTHYDETLRARKGRGSNEDLKNFIDILRGNRRSLAVRLAEQKNRGSLLYEELQTIKKKAKSGWKPYVSPEKRYTDSLANLEMKIKVKSRTAGFEQALIDDLKLVFTAASEMIKQQQTFLEQDRDRFAEAIFSETAFQILEFLDLGGQVMELPWISRFIAEEAVDAYAKMGIYDVVSEENKIERMKSAYMGGLAYLILQDHKREKAPVSGH